MENNCRLQYSKDILVDGSIVDIITIDGFVKKNKWKEVSFVFTEEERNKYKELIELYNLIK